VSERKWIVPFEEFFKAVTGFDPFPWQVRLAERMAMGQPPRYLNLPPALGKTLIVLCWVWALAQQKPGTGRRVPLRLVYVAPRQVIVDDALDAAANIADMLSNPEASSAIRKVADALRAFTAREGDPLVTARMRGSVPRDTSWYSRPDQPAVIVTTQEMAGSGLLFRHWTSSPKIRSIVAGLLGIDAAWVIDEAHIQQPFCDTLDRCLGARSETWPSLSKLGVPMWFPIRMSATNRPGPDGSDVFTMSEEDQQNPVIQARLGTKRRIRLHETTEPLADSIVKRVEEVLKDGQDTRLLVVVNSVPDARAVHKKLTKDNKKSEIVKAVKAHQVLLLHGQQREIERASTMERVKRGFPMAPVEDSTTTEQSPWILVATSAIEVGADISADRLITEACPLDSLIQRLGRLGRCAERYPDGEYVSDVIFPVPKKGQDKDGNGEKKGKKKKEEKEDKHTRESAAKATYDFLRNLAGDKSDLLIEGNPSSFFDNKLKDSGGERLLSPAAPSAPLWPEDLFMLAHTCPTPPASVDIETLIEGCEGIDPTVRVAWRADLEVGQEERWVELMKQWPLRPHELVEVYINNVKQLLDEVEKRAKGAGKVQFLAQQGDRFDVVEQHEIEQIRFGTTIVLPSSYGGYGEFGFDPESKEPVVDVADVFTEHPAGPRLRLDSRIYGFETNTWQTLDLDDTTANEEEQFARQALDDFREALEQQLQAEQQCDMLCGVKKTVDELLDELSKPSTTARYGNRDDRVTWDVVRPVPWDDETLCNIGKRVSLVDHAHDVAERAITMAQRLGVDDEETLKSIAIGALMHDDGKLNARFQHSLKNTDLSYPLAKSGLPRSRWKRAAEEAGLPSRWRHEAVSSLSAMKAGGPLAAHLAGSSHGWGRPWFQKTKETDPPETKGAIGTRTVKVMGNPCQREVNGGEHRLAERFDGLHREWGPWALGWLEAMIRLADWLASASPRTKSEICLEAIVAVLASACSAGTSRTKSEICLEAIGTIPDSASTQVSGGEAAVGTQQRHEVKLAGLGGDSLSGWLAAIGVLGVCASSDAWATLRWEPESQGWWIPTLESSLDEDGVVAVVADRIEGLIAAATKGKDPATKNKDPWWCQGKVPADTLAKQSKGVPLSGLLPCPEDAVDWDIFACTLFRGSGKWWGVHQLLANFSGRMTLQGWLRSLQERLAASNASKEIRRVLFGRPGWQGGAGPSLGFDAGAAASAGTGAGCLDLVRDAIGLLGVSCLATIAVNRHEWVGVRWKEPLSLRGVLDLAFGWKLAEVTEKVVHYSARSRIAEGTSQYREWVIVTR